MGKTIATIGLVLLAATSDANAGTLANGTWATANCGSQPATPTIDDSSAKAFNDSLKGLKEWQQKAQTYINCLIKEANADSQIIAGSANAEQDRFSAAVADINAAAAAGKAKLDGK